MKLKNAAQMVEKMSKFSRGFIALNSLSQIVGKNRQRQQAKAFIRWVRRGGNNGEGREDAHEECELKLR